MIEKRKSKGFHFYPKKRKKKRKHTQFMEYERVLHDWGFIPSMFHIFPVEQGSKMTWWACLPDANFYGNIEVQGEYFKPVWPLDFYDGSAGDVVYGYIGVVYYSHGAIYQGKFVFMKNPMNAGKDLTHALQIKRKVNFERFKMFEIWKK